MDYDVIDDGGKYKSSSIEVFLERVVRVFSCFFFLEIGQ